MMMKLLNVALRVAIVLPLGLSPAGAQLPPVPDSTEADAKAQPRLYVAQRTQDIGVILEGDKPAVHWILENRGGADLVIESTKATCGCAIVKLAEDDKIIPAGQSRVLTVEFDSSGRFGPQSKGVTVNTNDPAEPAFKLEFTAYVGALYVIDPPRLVNAGPLRRGETATRTIDITPGPGRSSVEILSVTLTSDEALSLTHEPVASGESVGQRIHITADQGAALGRVHIKAIIKLRIDELERKTVVPIRAVIVGDLTWHPKVLDGTRQPSPRGRRLAAVTVRSTGSEPLDVLDAQAGPLFDVLIEPGKGPKRRTRCAVHLTLREDAPVGPFAAMLRLRTSSLDQPVIEIPVFGIVAAPVVVDPPVVVLRQDGTPAGTRRSIKIQAQPQMQLTISDPRCDHQAVKVRIDESAGSRYHHICFLDVWLSEGLEEGTYETVLSVVTNIDGAERLEIPVTIQVPRRRG